MVWTVTYRSNGGAQETTTLEAESRSALFDELKKRGISAIRVEEGGKIARKSASAIKVPGAFKGILAGIIVVSVLAFAIALFFYPKANKPVAVEDPKDSKKLVEEPSAPMEQPKTASAITNVVEKKIDDDKYRDERGILRFKATGTRAYDPDRPTRKINLNMGADGKPLYKPSPFKNRAENEIYRLIKAEPGQQLFGARKYDERFEAEYKKSLETPIIIDKDDDEETIAAKNAMNEAKIEINERMRNGESLAEILDSTRSELKRLADLKRDLSKEVLSAVNNPELSERDVELYLEAANKMLAEKGVAPIKGGAMLRRSLILRSKGDK